MESLLPENERPDKPLIEAFVAQALDDLEAGRFDVATALRKIASYTWCASRQSAATTGSPAAPCRRDEVRTLMPVTSAEGAPSNGWTVGRLRSRLSDIPGHLPVLINVNVLVPGQEGPDSVPLAIDTAGFRASVDAPQTPDLFDINAGNPDSGPLVYIPLADE
ncbi:hypothetical protein LQ327_09855 [Actinomycetospora endophytica]|uniref:Uncharacterized protein n=1 Tax=Actinomycetospora endophytica TaxID=2291215 RepID=A0ABS8P5Z0_9PSEU|nr:hypothetical protein [Actinomycetospora endophytica]MCD2193680.1 hypothetical protein [Actinomycetospora endophytica]